MKKMLNVDLVSTLEKEHGQAKQERNEVIADAGLNQVKGLLGYDEGRHNTIMSNLASSSVNLAVQKVQSVSIELEKTEDYYGGKVFTTEQIKNLCQTYRLKFLNSNEFKGSMDVEVVAQIKKLEKCIGDSRAKDRAARENITVEEYKAQNPAFTFDNDELKRKFFVLAPPAMFNLTVEPKPAKIARVRNYDPILFYVPEDGKNIMVHKWGNDFSIFRAVKGFIFKNESNFLFCTALLIASILGLGLATFTDIFINAHSGYSFLAILAVVIISPILAILSLPKTTSAMYSEHGWNKTFKS